MTRARHTRTSGPAPGSRPDLASGAASVLVPGLTFGLAHGARTPIPAIFGQPAATLATDLAKFQSDGAGTWQQTVRDIPARYGPFTLAYLETIVRVADWRASAGQDLPANLA